MREEEKRPQYDALVVLGAVMAWDERRKTWAFPTIIPHYTGKLVMGKARALAVREIQSSAACILVTGGSDKNPVTGKNDSRSIELSKLITERYGVPKDKVFPIGAGNASHTQGNVQNLCMFLKEHPRVVQRGRIAILCLRSHRERAQLMFQSNPYFREHGIELDWIIVEEVLEARSPRYKKWADRVSATKEAAINKKMEQQGIHAFLQGTYEVRS